MDSAAPAVIAYRYELKEQLGKGGMGSVYRAYDRLEDTHVALKRVTVPAETLRFGSVGATIQFGSPATALTNEFKVLASLRHPNIISVLDYGFHTDQTPYFTMSYLEQGQNLYQACAHQTLQTRLAFIIQMLQALGYLHQRGILHRDLKPSNVLVEADVARLLDFGVSAQHDSHGMSAAGTLAYMSPEVLQMKASTPASDLYAIGMMLYELITGRHPFWQHNNVNELVRQIIHDPPPVRFLEGNPALRDVVLRLLAKSPAERYQSAMDVIQDLTVAADLPTVREDSRIRESYLQAAHFVGREYEMRILSVAVDRLVKEQRGSAWLIGGESGVGKTRLLEEIQTHAQVSGVMVLRGQGTESHTPYQIWRDALRHLALTDSIDSATASILKSVVPDIDSLMRRDIPTATPLADIANQRRLHLAIARSLREVQHPTLLILEDIHWATESLDPLRVIIKEIAEYPVMIVGAYQDARLPTLPQHLPQMRHVQLQRFSPEEIAQLSESMLGAAGRKPEILTLLEEETEGNAFFIVEVVRELAKQAGNLHHVGHITLPMNIFAKGISTVVQSLLSGLSPEVIRFLKVAALAGRRLDLEVLAPAAPNGLTTQLTDLAEKRIVTITNNQWQFAHDKIREVLVGMVQDEERQVLCYHLAQLTEDRYGKEATYAGVLSDRWADAHDPPKAARFGLRAGEYALTTGNFRSALRYLNRASQHYSMERSPSNLGYILKLQGDAALGFGDWNSASQQYNASLTAAKSIHNPIGIIEALNGLGRTYRHLNDYPQAKTYFEQALSLARRHRQRANLAITLSGLGGIHIHNMRYALAKAYLLESLALQNLLRDQSGQIETLQTLCQLEINRADWDAARYYITKALWQSQAIGDKSLEGDSRFYMGNICELEKRYLDAVQHYRHARDIFVEVGNIRGEARCWHGLASVEQIQRNHRTALEYYQASQALVGEVNLADTQCYNLCNMAFSHLALDKQDLAYEYLQEALQLATDIRLPQAQARALAGFAWLQLREGLADRAAQILGMVQAHYPSNTPFTQHYIQTVSDQISRALDADTFSLNQRYGASLTPQTLIGQLLL